MPTKVHVVMDGGGNVRVCEIDGHRIPGVDSVTPKITPDKGTAVTIKISPAEFVGEIDPKLFDPVNEAKKNRHPSKKKPAARRSPLKSVGK